MRASSLAEKIGGVFEGPGNPELDSIAPLTEARDAQVAFLHNPAYGKFLELTEASCVVLTKESLPTARRFSAIVHPDPHRAMALAVEILYPAEIEFEGIHKNAHIDPTATIGNNVAIAPFAFVGPECVIGDNCRISSGCVLSAKIHLGPNCALHPNVTIYPNTWLGENCIVHSGAVLGSDGFGFAPVKDGILKVRQVGKLVIEQDVEIGANCAIDRGSFTETRIGRGTKLDNMVHIGHNCVIGEYCLIAAQTGLAGSTVLGNRAMVGGQVGFAGHQKIGDNCVFLAKSGIKGNIPAGSRFFGYPAKDAMVTHRENGYISRLGKLFKRVKEIEEKLGVHEEQQEEK